MLVMIAMVAPAWAVSGDPLVAWARHDGGLNAVQGLGVAVDASGNTVVVGTFRFAATFGAGEPNETTLATTGVIRSFVASYDTSGELRWARPVDGTGTVMAEAVAMDADGNAVVTGRFEGSTTLGTGESNETTLVSAGNVDVFVASYDTNGSLRWARRAGGSGDGFGQSVALDVDGNATVTGRFSLSATFGVGESNQTTLVSAGGSDAFVASYDPGGALRWARRAGGPGAVQGEGVAVGADGRTVVAGYFNGSASFGSGEPNQTVLVSTNPGTDMFIAGYDETGRLRWARQAGGTSIVQALDVAVDSDGNGVVAGRFFASAVFGAGEANETTLESHGSDDFFVASYDTSGALRWARSAGGTLSVQGLGVATDANGHATVTGRFFGSATFGDETNQATMVSAGADDVFVATFDRAGVLRWAQRAGGTSPASGNAVAVGPDGHATVTGRFAGTATFGEGENDITLLSGGREDVFVVRYMSAQEPGEELQGPAEQLEALGELVADKGAGLTATVRAAQRSFEKDNLTAACRQLAALGRQVEALARGPHLSPEDAVLITADIERVRVTLECGER